MVVVKYGGGDDLWWWLVFVGVISFRSNLCYTGPCLSSLDLVCAFWVV